MAPKTHSLVARASGFAGFIAGALLAVFTGKDLESVGVPFAVTFLSLPAVCAALPQLLFRLVPSQCPQCGGDCFPRGWAGERYVCRYCDHVYQPATLPTLISSEKPLPPSVAAGLNESPGWTIAKRSTGVLALAGFVTSLVVHAVTFLSLYPPRPFWLLHLGIFVVFIPMVVSQNRLRRIVRTPEKAPDVPSVHRSFRLTGGGFARLSEMAAAGRSQRAALDELTRFVPWRLRALCGAFFIYAFVNFGLFVKNMEGGVPGRDGDNYYLHSHGRKIRDLAEKEYRQFHVYEVRGFSGHWMVFYLIPAAYFLVAEPKARRAWLEASVSRFNIAVPEGGSEFREKQPG